MSIFWISFAAIVYCTLLSALLVFLAGVGKVNEMAEHSEEDLLIRLKEPSNWKRAA